MPFPPDGPRLPAYFPRFNPIRMLVEYHPHLHTTGMIPPQCGQDGIARQIVNIEVPCMPRIGDDLNNGGLRSVLL